MHSILSGSSCCYSSGWRHLGHRGIFPAATPAMPLWPHEEQANAVGTTAGPCVTAPPRLRNAASAASASLLRSARLLEGRAGREVRCRAMIPAFRYERKPRGLDFEAR